MRRKLEYLSTRQEAILSCIRREIVERGEAPTVREIAQSVGLSSTSSVAYQLRQLEKRGEITREVRQARSTRLGHGTPRFQPPQPALSGVVPSAFGTTPH